MKNKIDLSEPEIKYLLGDEYKFRLKEILTSKVVVPQKTVSKEKTKEKDKKENLQQSLLDF